MENSRAERISGEIGIIAETSRKAKNKEGQETSVSAMWH